jgi:hypothetical protein
VGLDVHTAALPAQKRLVDVATVKARLNVGVSTFDSMFEDLIDEASQAIVEQIGFDLVRQTYHEALQGHGKPYIRLSRWPVDRDSIPQIFINGIAIPYDGTSWRFHDSRIGKLFLSGGWSSPSGMGGYYGGYYEGPGYYGYSNTIYGEDTNIDVSFTAGYLTPGMVNDWAPGVVITPGSWVRPLTAGTPLLFLCTAGGTTGMTEPAWPVPTITYPDGVRSMVTSQFTVSDGSVTWASHDALELPYELKKFAYLAVKASWLSRLRPDDVTTRELDGARETYDAKLVGLELPQGVINGLSRWHAAAAA